MEQLKQLDLGCGNPGVMESHAAPNHEIWGIDIVDYSHPRIGVADLAIDKIPFGNNQFDLVTAFQFLEHIPKVIYNPTKRNCLIELFNEIYRVLKDGGEFHFDVPLAGTTAYWGDPTHVSEWFHDSINYFSGDYFGFHDDYGHKSKFKKLLVETDPDRPWRLIVGLKAIKPLGPPYEL